MDIEFHYYLTYLIAAKAGFSAEDSEILAYSCQLTDDNTEIYEISKGTGQSYSNYISQTSDILKPKEELFRIYSHFHFVPGFPEEATARRKDGKMHWLNTTPNSENANMIFDAALRTDNLYRIGIACHAFADTFAHQNFIGYYDSFNHMSGILGNVIPQIGHAHALHNPDWPAHIWVDERLFDDISTVFNYERFKSAAMYMYQRLRRYKNKSITENDLKNEAWSVGNFVVGAIGKTDKNNDRKDERISGYCRLGKNQDCGEKEIPEYVKNSWFDEAINEDGFKPIVSDLTWKDSTKYKDTNWYKFQEAVKQHQNETWDILKGRNFAHVQLEKL